MTIAYELSFCHQISDKYLKSLVNTARNCYDFQCENNLNSIARTSSKLDSLYIEIKEQRELVKNMSDDEIMIFYWKENYIKFEDKYYSISDYNDWMGPYSKKFYNSIELSDQNDILEFRKLIESNWYHCVQPDKCIFSSRQRLSNTLESIDWLIETNSIGKIFIKQIELYENF